MRSPIAWSRPTDSSNRWDDDAVNPSTAQAHVILDELLRCGITDVVVAPGSRSAPLAIAAAEAEERGELVLHVRVDERSAGFLALGLAKLTGVPVVIITTSGTSVANLLPAIIEADLSSIPLIALTADRPFSLRAVGANQEIDQAGIFGTKVRSSTDMVQAHAEVGAVRAWRSAIARAVATSTDATFPGPVHVNVPFADPLVPDGDDAWVEPLVGRPGGRPWTADLRLLGGMSTPLDDVLEQLLDDATVPARGLIVIGDHQDGEAVELADDLADAMGWPVIAEPSANAASCSTIVSHGSMLLADASFADEHVPDIVVTIGRIGLARSVMRMIARAPLHVAVDADPRWADPTRSADIVIAGVPLAPTQAEVDDAWLASWGKADVLAAAALETVLATDSFTGVHVARTAVACVPEDGLLFLGPSWPVRHVFAFAGTSVSTAAVIGNRGTSGIDGCISTAWGAALGMERGGGGATVALVGDLTFFYDSNGLAVPEGEDRPDLVIVVSDNNGGGIFSTLEQADNPHFERVFATALPVDASTIAEAMGVSSVVVESEVQLATAIAESLSVGGVHVVVARTCERGEEAAILRQAQDAVSAVIASV
jgi:2-succinyl-5-enolpyruvyl-6-hydroxy-3-cyclohexene-1-carboxylate synthase